MGNSFLKRNLLNEIVSPYDYCLAINLNTTLDEKTDTQILQTRRKKIYTLYQSSFGKITESLIFSRLKFSFFFPNLFIKTVEIKVKNKALMDYSVKRYIKQLSMFENDFRFSYDIISYSNEIAKVNIFVMPPEKADEIIKQVPFQLFPVSCIVPVEKVLVGLISSISANLVVSVFVKNQQILCLASKGKEIISRLCLSLNYEDSQIAKQILMDGYIHTFVQSVKNHAENSTLSLLIWGEYYKAISSELNSDPELKIDKALEEKICQSLTWRNYHKGFFKRNKTPPESSKKKPKTGKQQTSIAQQQNIEKPKNLNQIVSQEALFTQPEIFGLCLCQKSQTFLSLDYKHSYNRLANARYSLLISILIFVSAAAISIYNYYSASETKEEINLQSSNIENNIRRIQSEMPNQLVLSKLVEKAQKRSLLRSELNLKNFLGWLTDITPQDAIVENLTIELFKEESNPKKRNKANKADEKKRYQVQLTLFLNRIYAESINDVDQFLNKLNLRVKQPYSKFVHISEDKHLPTEVSLKFIVESGQFL